MTDDPNDSLPTRPSLLARMKDWSRQTAWREFDHDYAPLVRNVARKAGLSQAEADDVVQETLLAVAKKIGEFEHAGNRGSFRAWLYQQARWRIADQFRKRQPAPPTSRKTPATTPGGDDTEMAALDEVSGVAASEFERIWTDEWRERIRLIAIERVKRRVSARQFQLFDLHALQGLSVEEAAATAGSTIAAVYMAKSRVQRLFQRELKAAMDENS